MGNVQSSHSTDHHQHQQDGNRSAPSSPSPFLFQPCEMPTHPFAAKKKGMLRRRVRATIQQVQLGDDRGTTEESSTTSSLPSATGKGMRLPSKLPNCRTILQQLIELQDWQRVLCRLELYPDEISQYIPLYIDNLMIEPAATPNKSSSQFKISMQSNHYSIIYVTPLHFVCALNPPLLVITTMLRLGGVETASMPIRPNTRKKFGKIKKELFRHHQRQTRSLRGSSRLIRSASSTARKPYGNKSDDQSHVSDDTPSMSFKRNIVQSSSSESSSWHHKINFRFSFDDYKQRVKYSGRNRRMRGGAFPIVEELNEDFDEDVDSVDKLEFQQQFETQPSSIVTGNITTATTADCSQSQQSSISATPPRSTDQTVILQLSSSGDVHPFPLRMVQNVKSPASLSTTRAKMHYQHESLSENTTIPEMNVRPHCFTDSRKHSSMFRVRWDLTPLLQHVVHEGSLLPVHVATLYSASSDVLVALVEAYPLAALRDVFGMLPIHFVAAGWLLPQILPNPVVLQHKNVPCSLEDIDDTSTSPCGALEYLVALQRAEPDSVRIRSGSHGMKPEEYINECMENGPYKDACVRVLNEGLNIKVGNDASRLFDVDTSISSSTDDIFEFTDTINSSGDDLKINHVPSTDIEPSFEYLSSLMAVRDWQSVLIAIEKYPHLAAKWIVGIDDVSASMYKRLPLHCACLYGGPIELIVKLINLNPDGVKTVDPTDLSTPLSLACFANASVEVIRVILIAYPKAINIVNIYGQVPLHVAVLSKVPYDVIELLVEDMPHLALLKDNDGRNPIKYAKTIYGENDIVYQFLLVIKDVLLTKSVRC